MKGVDPAKGIDQRKGAPFAFHENKGITTKFLSAKRFEAHRDYDPMPVKHFEAEKSQKKHPPGREEAFPHHPDSAPPDSARSDFSRSEQ
jgi:hypothetical protein